MACQTRVGCARAQWKLHDPEMQTLCLTIIIPFLSPLVCRLIISAAAVTERFIDNSSGVCVCACMSNCASLRAHMWHQAAISAPSSGSFLSQLTQSPFTPAPQGNFFFSFFFFFSFRSLMFPVRVLTGHSRHQSQRSEHSECPQSLDIEACRLSSDRSGAVPLGGLLQDRTE